MVVGQVPVLVLLTVVHLISNLLFTRQARHRRVLGQISGLSLTSASDLIKRPRNAEAGAVGPESPVDRVQKVGQVPTAHVSGEVFLTADTWLDTWHGGKPFDCRASSASQAALIS